MREWLKEKRKEKGLTQQNVADKLGITQQHYTWIEKNKRCKKLKLSQVLKLSEVLDVSLEFIIEEEMR